MKRVILWGVTITLCLFFVGCSSTTQEKELDKTETLGSLSYKVNSEWNKTESSDYEKTALDLPPLKYGETFVDTITYVSIDENEEALPLVVLRIRSFGTTWSNDWDAATRSDTWQTIMNGTINDVFSIGKDSIEFATYFFENDMSIADAEFTSADGGIYRGKITMIANGDETYVLCLVQKPQMSDSSKKLYESIIDNINITKYSYPEKSKPSKSSGSYSQSTPTPPKDYSSGSDWENYDSDSDGQISDSEFQDAVGDWMDEHGY